MRLLSVPLMALLAVVQLACAQAPRDAKPAAGSAFDGDWIFRGCEAGHVVTVELNTQAQAVTGAWSAGTLVRGTQGQLKGAVVNGALEAALCDEGGEVGGYPACPQFSESNDRFERRGDTLVWSRQLDGPALPDVVLHRSEAPMELSCDDVSRVAYPVALHGLWVGEASKCPSVDGGYDGELILEISARRMVGYEQVYKPVSVARLSDGIGWRIESLIDVGPSGISEPTGPQTFVLERNVLTVADGDRVERFRHCPGY